MLRSERSSVAIRLGLMIIVVRGMVPLGVEITFVPYKHRQMQSAADSATLDGTVAPMRGYPADLRAKARAIAAGTGFVNGLDNVTVTVNHRGKADLRPGTATGRVASRSTAWPRQREKQ